MTTITGRIVINPLTKFKIKKHHQHLIIIHRKLHDNDNRRTVTNRVINL